MASIKNVALVGATGNLGPSVLEALLKTKDFNITVLKRAESKSKLPASVKVKVVDFEDEASLVAALKGQDAVVSTLGTPGFALQTRLIDAAASAGVKRFIPSEFGSDTANPKNSKLPVFQPKIQVDEYLQKKFPKTGLTYTFVHNGPFLDWGLKVPFLLDVQGHKAELYDGGDQLFSATTLAGVGKAVVGVLNHFEDTKNRFVYVQEAAVSQKQLLNILKKARPDTKWVEEVVSTSDLEAKANEDLSKGNIHDGIWVSFIKRAIFGSGYGGHFKKLDNDLLDVKTFTPSELEAAVVSTLG
ncbi:putative Bifunctional pinoresinol-lariciresinol reductase [Seiridium unicorne]|uniref:Bifunctional pinoresinol-lariciresinol reductase n=1 Tax=Seiridium unicorne TaxID=138068 RepID=A0ABR2UM47_9PEZI